ncbi:hypothetical protein MNBD_ALPHA12-2123 [hydrothermal vent metagenome]|uniref:Uncharacterized protein n=1 Tax=hydrothermal vent metagenome TaxID=652676 RepID=A0A3B0TXL9_9ZZZZ
MSTNSTLSELAKFVGQSETRSLDKSSFWHAYRRASQATRKHSAQAKVTDLLAMVMALSARTRRVAAPRAMVELDVFAPNGARAVRLIMGNGGSI